MVFSLFGVASFQLAVCILVSSMCFHGIRARLFLSLDNITLYGVQVAYPFTLKKII